MSGISSFIYQVVLLFAATFVFLVLFQYGTADFRQHAQAEWAWVASLAKRPAAETAVPN